MGLDIGSVANTGTVVLDSVVVVVPESARDRGVVETVVGDVERKSGVAWKVGRQGRAYPYPQDRSR